MKIGSDTSVNAAIGTVGVMEAPGAKPFGSPTGFSQATTLGEAAADVAGFGMPTISITSIELSNSIEMARPKQDPHIDHPNEVSTPTLDEIQEANDNTSMNVSIKMLFREIIGSDGLFTFISKSEFIKYMSVCVVQCMGEEMHQQITKNENTFLNPVDGTIFEKSESMSGIEVHHHNLIEFIGGKANLITSMIEQGISSTDIKQIEKLIPFVKDIDQNGNTIYTIPLEDLFHIPTSKGGSNIEFLSYFVYSYFDFKSFMKDSIEKFGKSANIKIPEISFKNYTMSNVSSDIVLLNKSVQTDAFVFVDNKGNYFTGPKHLMPDGTYMKGKHHVEQGPRYVNTVNKVLTKKTVPNAKVVDNRQFIKISKANFNYSRASEFITNNDVVNSLAQNLGTESLLLKPKATISNFWCATDITGKNRFAFTVNMSNLLSKNTVFPGLLQTIQDTNELEYQDLISSIEIKEFSIIRRRINKENQITSEVNMTSPSPDDVPFKLITTEDFRGRLMAKTQVTDQFGNAKVKKLKKICSIEEIFIKNAEGFTRTFSGTDIDISSKNEGKYQYELNIKAIDPVPRYIKSKITTLEAILEGGDGLKGWNNYLQLCSEPQYSDKILNRFTVNFLPAFNDFMASAPENFINNSIIKYVDILFLFNVDEDSISEATNAIKMIEYLSNISSPNTGNPSGAQVVASLIQDLIKKLNDLLNQMSHYKKLKAQGHTNERAETTIVGGHTNKVFEFSHIFKKIVELSGTSIESPIGYDFLSTNINSTAANLAGLRVINRKKLRTRFDLETSKLFNVARNSEASIEIKEKGTSPSTTPVVYNTGDTISAKKYSFLAPSYVYLPRRDTQNIIQNGTTSAGPSSPASLNDLMLDVIRFKKDRAEGLSTKNISNSKSIDLPLRTQRRRMDLIKHFAEKGATFEEPGSEILQKGENGLPNIASQIISNAIIPSSQFSTEIKPISLNKNIFSSENTSFQSLQASEQQELLAEQSSFFNNFAFAGTDILTSTINPNALLYSMTVLDDFEFIDKDLEDDEKFNSLLYYNLESPAGGKKIKNEIIAYGLAKAIAGAFGSQETSLPKESPLTAAPNHVKSLILSADQRDIAANGTLYEYINSGNDPFKNPLYYAYINFNYKILNQIEVFRGFVKKNGETMVSEASWGLLKDFDLTEENFDDDTLLLCRQKRYMNNSMGISSDIRMSLSMPFFDEYFLVTSEDIQDTLNIKTDFNVLTANFNTSKTNQTNSPIRKKIFNDPRSAISTSFSTAGFSGISDQTSQYRASNSLRQKMDFISSRESSYDKTRGEEKSAIRTEFTSTNIMNSGKSDSMTGVRKSPNKRAAAEATKVFNKMNNSQLFEILDSLKLTNLSEVNNIRATASQEKTNGEIVSRSQNITKEEMEILEELGDSREYKQAIEKLKTSSNINTSGTSPSRSSSGQSSGGGSGGSTSGGGGGGGYG